MPSDDVDLEALKTARFVKTVDLKVWCLFCAADTTDGEQFLMVEIRPAIYECTRCRHQVNVLFA